MTEQEWLQGEDPGKMLDYARYGATLKGRSNISERKLRLFTCACCRHVWQQMTEGNCRQALEIAEQYADGLATMDQVVMARGLVHGSYAMHKSRSIGGYSGGKVSPHRSEEMAVRWALSEQPLVGVRTMLDHGGKVGLSPGIQAALLRDIVGNPFRPVTKCSRCSGYRFGAHGHVGFTTGERCTHCGGTGSETCRTNRSIRHLAWAIYQERRFEDMPVLADMLEEAGCLDQDILQHCRGAGPHVRGCWVLDLLLGKE